MLELATLINFFPTWFKIHIFIYSHLHFIYVTRAQDIASIICIFVCSWQLLALHAFNNYFVDTLHLRDFNTAVSANPLPCSDVIIMIMTSNMMMMMMMMAVFIIIIVFVIVLKLKATRTTTTPVKVTATDGAVKLFASNIVVTVIIVTTLRGVTGLNHKRVTVHQKNYSRNVIKTHMYTSRLMYVPTHTHTHTERSELDNLEGHCLDVLFVSNFKFSSNKKLAHE